MAVKPNFFIVGAAKSGTSSLAHNIAQHPDIYISPVKEPFYFIPDAGLKDFDEYMSLFRRAGRAKAIGEASSGYMFDEHSPSEIYKHFPDARIISILRNPPDMAFSYWRYMRLIGNESKSFEEAISDEERRYRRTEDFKRRALDWWASYIYLERAMYFSQVKRYIDIFGRRNVRVYIFEDFFNTPDESHRDIFSFLGVDVSFTPDYSVKNEGGDVRFRFIKKIRDRKYPFLKKLISFEHRIKMKKVLLDINVIKGNNIYMNSETRRKLDAFFEDDIRSLEKLLGYEIRAWKKK